MSAKGHEPAMASSSGQAARAASGAERLRDVLGHAVNLPSSELVKVLQEDLARRWAQGDRLSAEEYLRAFPHVAADNEAASDLVYNEFVVRDQLGESPDLQEYVRRFPMLAAELGRLHEYAQFADFLPFLGSDALSRPLFAPGEVESRPLDAPAATAPVPARQTTRMRCPHCHDPIELDGGHTAGARHAERSTDREEVVCPGCGNTLRVREAWQPASPAPVRQIGKFQLLARVGLGSFGAVWKARDIELDRIVALKIAHAGLATLPTDEERFHREARAAAQLRHPGIVCVHEVQTLEGLPAIVADFIDGVPLSTLLTTRRLTFREAAMLLADVAEALDYAHRMGLVHRDLKPSNIMLDPSRPGAAADLGRPLIMDFGLALRAEAEVTMTLDGFVIGTPAYMSPEQAAGTGHQADRRSDVYSLGVILYELLTGELPFRGSPAMLVHQVLHEEPRAPRRSNDTIPRDLETICLKAMAKGPGQRYGTARELAEDLRRFLDGEPIRARPAGRAERLWRWCRREPAVASLSGMLALLLVATVLASWYVQYQFAQNRQQQRTDSLVDRILETDTWKVPLLVDDLNENRRRAEPRLAEILHRPATSAKQRLHARMALALMLADHGQVEDLYDDLLKAKSQDFAAIRTALLPYKDRFTDRLWQRLDESPSRQERLRAACALAAFDRDSSRWTRVAPGVVANLLAEELRFVPDWQEALRPVGPALLKSLRQSFNDKDKPAERSLSATILADYAANQPEVLADLILDADPGQFAILWPVFQPDAAALSLMEQAAQAAASNGPDVPEDERERLATRQANAAIALFKMGRSAAVWPLLQHSPDPRVRSYLVHRLGPLGVDPQAILTRLEPDRDTSIRRALLLSLGEFNLDQLSLAQRERLIPELAHIYREDPDAGIHSSVAWLLRQWGLGERLKEIDKELAAGKRCAEHDWYVNGQGQTLTIIRGPVELWMGSPPTEAGREADEGLHRHRIGRTFAISTTHVTVEQFRRFIPAVVTEQRHNKFSPEPDCPILLCTWFDAAAYCNWLSEQEGLPKTEWCYEPNGAGQYADGMSLAPNYLRRTGYRLPTEAEGEFAIRAGAVTSRCYGQSAELLEKYDWHREITPDRSWPVGSKKPNDLGLFDVHGNAWFWCQDRYRACVPSEEGGTEEDVEEALPISEKDHRVLRGGSFTDNSRYHRSAMRNYIRPDGTHVSVGFRVARTLAEPAGNSAARGN